MMNDKAFTAYIFLKNFIVSDLTITDPSSKATLWVKAQHEGTLPPPCIVRNDPRVPHTARRGACDPLSTLPLAMRMDT